MNIINFMEHHQIVLFILVAIIEIILITACVYIDKDRRTDAAFFTWGYILSCVPGVNAFMLFIAIIASIVSSIIWLYKNGVNLLINKIEHVEKENKKKELKEIEKFRLIKNWLIQSGQFSCRTEVEEFIDGLAVSEKLT